MVPFISLVTFYHMTCICMKLTSRVSISFFVFFIPFSLCCPCQGSTDRTTWTRSLKRAILKKLSSKDRIGSTFRSVDPWFLSHLDHHHWLYTNLGQNVPHQFCLFVFLQLFPVFLANLKGLI